MKNNDVYKTWNDFITSEKYKTYFLDLKETWYKKLEDVEKHILENNKLPNRCSTDLQIKTLGSWIYTQSKNFKHKKDIMKNEDIYNSWKIFSDKYIKDYNKIWNNNLYELKKYIDTHNKLPTNNPNDKISTKLNTWITTQVYYYRRDDIKKYLQYDELHSFITESKYKNYFKYLERTEYDSSIWFNKLETVKNYIDINKKRPSDSSKEPLVIELRIWISKQITHYREKIRDMKYPEIYNAWTNFINDDKYKEYFLDKKIIWYNNLDKLKKYIEENQKTPSEKKNNPDEVRKLAYWMNLQRINYESRKSLLLDEDIYLMWKEFINNQNYNKYFNFKK
jgi:hypothetical protein